MNKIKIKCKYCGSIFEDYLSNKKKYCSMKCRNNGFVGRKSWNKGLKGVLVAWTKGLKGYRAGEKHPWMPKKEEHYNWKGGKSFEKYTQYWTDDLKDSIRKRDNYICQECGIHQDELDMGQLTKLDVHHIDYDKKNCNPNNLITLCRSCHIKTNYNRSYWVGYFNEKIYE